MAQYSVFKGTSPPSLQKLKSRGYDELIKLQNGGSYLLEKLADRYCQDPKSHEFFESWLKTEMKAIEEALSALDNETGTAYSRPS